MLMQTQTTNINIYAKALPREHRLALVLLLFASSIVIADTTLRLDFPDEFYLQSTDKKLSRDNQTYRADKEEPEWRKPADSSSPTVRWGAKSIYEENKQLEPLIGTQGTGEAAETIYVNPQLELRF